MNLPALLDELESWVGAFPSHARPLDIINTIRGALAAHPASDTSGATMISIERGRQLTEEGWTPKHDDEHDKGELAVAAVCYAASTVPNAGGLISGGTVYALRKRELTEVRFEDPWPWDRSWDKRNKHGLTKRLAIAGALLAAEIDRRKRES